MSFNKLGRKSFTNSVKKKDGTEKYSSRGKTSKIPEELFNENIGLGEPIFPFETLYASENVVKDPYYKESIEIPNDDLQIVKVKVQRSQEEAELLKKVSSVKGLKDYIQQCLEYYNGDLIQIQRKNKGVKFDFAKKDQLSPHEFWRVVKDQNSENIINGNSEEKEAQDPINEDLLVYEGDVSDQKNTEARDRGRLQLFHLFDGAEKYLPERKIDNLFPPYSQPNTIEILVEPHELQFKLGNFEPFRCSLAIYDIIKKKRVSENFYFHVNPDELSNLLINKGDLPTDKRAIFQISNPSPNSTFLVLRVEKILQGDLEAIAEPYIKPENLKEKEKEKAVASSTYVCSRISYWQPFAWGMIPLFNDDLTLAPEENFQFRPLYRARDQEVSDEEFLTYLQEFNKNGSTKRSRTLGAQLNLTIKLINKSQSQFNLLSSSLILRNSQPGLEECKVILEFPLTPTPTPNIEYINDLLIYLESVNFSNRTGSQAARNIAISVKLLSDDSDSSAEGLKVFYSKGKTELVTSMSSTVTYHSKSPKFYDEIKVQLPPLLTYNHHFLFTFYHINVQPGKGSKANQPVEVPVGYAFWRIYPNDRIVGKEELSVFYELPKSGYLSDDATLKYIDNKKPIFNVRAKLHSTIYSQDVNLNNFFKRVKKITSSNSSSFSKSFEYMLKVHPLRIVKFFPVIFTYILQSICVDNSANNFKVIPELLQGIYNEAPDALAPLLGSYADNVFNFYESNGRCIYEVLTSELLLYIRDDGSECEIVLRYISCFFKLIFKSMVLKIFKSGELNVESTRETRFSERFITDLRGLLVILTWEAQQRCKAALTLGKEITRNIGYFVLDLISIMNRGVVFKMIEKFISEISLEDSDLTLIEYKYEFFKVISEFEYFVPLNLPIPTLKLPKRSKIIQFYLEKHFLVGSLLKEINISVQHTEKGVRMKGMNAIRKLLITHDYDPRYNSDPEITKRVISMYFPLVITMIDHPIPEDLVFEEKRDFLICFLYILQHTNWEVLEQWWIHETPTRIIRFFQTLQLCMQTFEFISEKDWVDKMMAGSDVKSSDKTKEMLENYYSGVGTPNKSRTYRGYRSSLAESKSTPGTPDNSNEPVTSSSLTHSVANERKFKKTINRGTNRLPVDNNQPLFDPLLETNLSNEVSFIILGIFEKFVNVMKSNFGEESLSTEILDKVLSLILQFLKTNHTISFLPHLYASFRSFINRFPNAIYNNTAFIGDFCYHILTHCNLKNSKTRREASALLFWLMKKYYLYSSVEQFPKITVQITIAMSKIVGMGIETDEYLKKSLNSISRYASIKFESDEQRPYPIFASSVESLTERLYSILRDNLKISKHSGDDEMTIDLYHRLANFYRNAPSLRITWLESLNNFNVNKENWAEAAMCNIHISSMIAEYLNATQPSCGLPTGAAFQLVSLNVIEEQSVRETSSVTENTGPEAALFTESKLVYHIQQSIDELKKGLLYETANEMYKPLIAIYEKNFLYKQLADCHLQLQELFNEIINSIETQSRMLGSYYRVGFYGDLFEELNGVEFIYKEPKITRLVEIKERLQELYEKRFGKSNFEILNHSNQVDSSTLKPGVAYIQLTSVAPYFSDTELAKRRTAFMRNNKIKDFFFETPFTSGGKVHTDDVTDQYLRKTFLTVEYSFPYMKRRLQVVEKDQIELTPLENAIELINQRTNKIYEEIRSEHPNIKTLQPVLSGSVCLQVNTGPLAYSSAFFDESRVSSLSAEKLNEFKIALNNFLNACEEGIEKHNKMIETDSEIAFHASLVNGFNDVRTQMHEHMGLKKKDRKKKKQKSGSNINSLR